MKKERKKEKDEVPREFGYRIVKRGIQMPPAEEVKRLGTRHKLSVYFS